MNNPILEEYAKKYKPEELTPDGIPNLETQLREMKEQDEKQQIDKVNHRREMLQRVKCISLFIMGKDIMTNTFNLNMRERDKLQEIMYLYNDVSEEDIIDKFNTVVNEVLFENDKVDLSKLPIYSYNK